MRESGEDGPEPSRPAGLRRRGRIVALVVAAACGAAIAIVALNEFHTSSDPQRVANRGNPTLPAGQKSAEPESAGPPTGPRTQEALAPPTSASDGGHCTVSTIMVPSCGAWWGAALGSDQLPQLESAADRKLDLVYTWHGIDQRDLPKPEERAWVKQGRFLHVNIETKYFTQHHQPARYADVVGGRFDDALRAQAAGFKKLGKPVFVTYEHEADQKSKYNVRGSPKEFVAAWRHLHDVYAKQGATNVIWVWNVTGYEGNFDKLPSIYPGDHYVDWLSWEAYNDGSCKGGPPDTFHTAVDAVRPMYEWVQKNGSKAGIDKNKPVMIGEAGTVDYPDDPSKVAQYWKSVPKVFSTFPNVRAFQTWNDGGDNACSYRVLDKPYEKSAFRTAGKTSIVNPPLPKALTDP